MTIYRDYFDDDTIREMDVHNFLRIAQDIGFEVHVRRFIEYPDGKYIRPTFLYLLFEKKRGILIQAEEWHWAHQKPLRRNISHATLYYQARPKDRSHMAARNFNRCITSGGWEGWPLGRGHEETEWWEHEDAVYVGTHHVDQLRSKIDHMDKCMEIITPWRQPHGFYWRTGLPSRAGREARNYREGDRKYSKWLVESSVAMLPKEVQEAIKYDTR